MSLGYAQIKQNRGHIRVSLKLTHKKGFDETPILVSEIHSLEDIELTKFNIVKLKDGTKFDFIIYENMKDKEKYLVKGKLTSAGDENTKEIQFLINPIEFKVESVSFLENQSIEIQMKVEQGR